MNINDIYQNESNRMEQAVTKFKEQAEDKVIRTFSDPRPLGASFRDKAIWPGAFTETGVSGNTYGVYIIYKGDNPVYCGEGVLSNRIGLSGYHNKTLERKGITPDPKKDSFMTKAYNDDPDFKDYEVIFHVVDTGNKQSNKSLGLLLESYIVAELNLEVNGYNAPGHVDPFVVYDSINKSKIKTTRAKNTSEEDIIQHMKDYRKSDMSKTAFALHIDVGKSTFTRWSNDKRYINVA